MSLCEPCLEIHQISKLISSQSQVRFITVCHLNLDQFDVEELS